MGLSGLALLLCSGCGKTETPGTNVSRLAGTNSQDAKAVETKLTSAPVPDRVKNAETLLNKGLTKEGMELLKEEIKDNPESIFAEFYLKALDKDNGAIPSEIVAYADKDSGIQERVLQAAEVVVREDFTPKIVFPSFHGDGDEGDVPASKATRLDHLLMQGQIEYMEYLFAKRPKLLEEPSMAYVYFTKKCGTAKGLSNAEAARLFAKRFPVSPFTDVARWKEIGRLLPMDKVSAKRELLTLASKGITKEGREAAKAELRRWRTTRVVSVPISGQQYLNPEYRLETLSLPKGTVFTMRMKTQVTHTVFERQYLVTMKELSVADCEEATLRNHWKTRNGNPNFLPVGSDKEFKYENTCTSGTLCFYISVPPPRSADTVEIEVEYADPISK